MKILDWFRRAFTADDNPVAAKKMSRKTTSTQAGIDAANAAMRAKNDAILAIIGPQPKTKRQRWLFKINRILRDYGRSRIERTEHSRSWFQDR